MYLNKEKNWFSKPRVETFSDGVLAIIITLLVLEIKVPEIENKTSINELKEALINLFPKFISWIISFFMICVIWVNHHRVFERISNVSHTIFWLNALLLLSCSFIPFPTALVGDYTQNPIALCLFGIVLSATGISFTLMRFAVLKQNLLTKQFDIKSFKLATLKTIIIGVLLYLFGAFIAFYNIALSLMIYLFIPIYFIFFNQKDYQVNTNNL